MQKPKRIFIAFFLIFITMAMCLLSGCGGGVTMPTDAKKAPVLVVPEEVYASQTDKGEQLGSYENIRIYLDNTWGMRGFLMANTKKESGFAKILNRLVGISEKYSTKEFYCLKDQEGQHYASWKKCKQDKFKYKAENFYSVKGRLYNPFSNDKDVGKGLNVYITDLDEGSEENKALALRLNKMIMEKGKNRSALLYCFPVGFCGDAWKDTGAIDENGNPLQKKSKINISNKPFYIIVFGPTREIEAFVDTFNKEMEDNGFRHNKDYYCEKFLSGRGMKSGEASFRTEPFEITTDVKNNDPLGKDYSFTNTDKDYDMLRISGNDVFCDLHKTLPGMFYCSSKILSGSESGFSMYNRRFSFVADLPKHSGEDIQYDLILSNVYYANSETADKKPIKEGSKKSYTEETFKEMDENQLYDLMDKKNDKRMLTITHEEFRTEIEKLRIDKNVFNAFSDKKKDKLASSGVDYKIQVGANRKGDASFFISIASNDGAKLQRTYDALIFNFAVIGKANISDMTVPDWIKKYDAATARVEGRYNKKVCAEELKYIYDYLNGTMANENEKKAYADYIETTICEFPVLVDFRSVKKY